MRSVFHFSHSLLLFAIFKFSYITDVNYSALYQYSHHLHMRICKEILQCVWILRYFWEGCLILSVSVFEV